MMTSVSAIPTQTRDRLHSVSSVSKKRRLSEDDYFSCPESEPEEDDTNTLPFTEVGGKKKNKASKGMQIKNKSYTSAVSTTNTPFVVPKVDNASKRRPPVYGTKKAQASSAYGGVAPKVFIYRCRPSTSADDVLNDLMSDNLDIESVEVASHPTARFRSFIVTPKSYADFKKLMSGDFIPENVGFRQYRARSQQQGSSDSAFSGHVRDSLHQLDSMGPSVINGHMPASPKSPMQVSSNSTEQDGAAEAVARVHASELLTSSQLTIHNEVNNKA